MVARVGRASIGEHPDQPPAGEVRSSVLEAEAGQWACVHAVNLEGTPISSQEFARLALRAGQPAAIAILSSLAGITAVPNRAPYVTSKHAVVGLTRAIMIRTSMTAPMFEDPEGERRVRESHALWREGFSEEVAPAIAFLASDDASFVTGVILPVDSGATAGRWWVGLALTLRPRNARGFPPSAGREWMGAMTTGFDGRVALVTGAGGGIGLGTAWAFAKAGASMIVADRDEEAAEKAAEGLRTAGHNALGITCDVTDKAQVEAMTERAVRTYGRLEAAFNNAAVNSEAAAFLETSDTEFERVINVNLRSVWNRMKAKLRQMVAQQPIGRFGEPGEIAAAVVRLCGPAASFTEALPRWSMAAFSQDN